MGNKTSKKTETSTAVAKHKNPSSISFKGSAQPVAGQKNDASEWVMVLNTTAYIRSGTLGNAGIMTNLATANKVLQHSEQTTRTNAVADIVHRSNAITHHNSNSSNTFGNQALQRQAVSICVEAPDMLKEDKSQNDTYLFNTASVASKSSRITLSEIKPQTPRSGKQDVTHELTLNANQAKQQTNYAGKEQQRLQIEYKPQYNNAVQLGNDRDARAKEGFMWRQVNRAENGRWNHFRRIGGGKYKCILCYMNFSGPQCVIDHVWGKFHQANLDKKCMNETNEDLLWRQVPMPEKSHRKYIYEIDGDNQSLFYCSVCEVELPFTYQNLLTHIRGRNHSEEVEFQGGD
ncbi:hypothetical protein PR048_028608 [Dryococelus australis]|uniref:U1-type domain-containing protein n=1 Tax=Dryococelus australis TaxID=614101 RepID=A0ABQ9GB43_9NEOP|nr:hypothetical protein PR048_028608 [Dryococelus australis]